jgi:2-methylisocitrate lyase-like PEP mutase family enzyme
MPLVNREATSKFREIINRPGATIVPGGSIPIQAVLAQNAGYEAFHLSGGFYHNYFLGVPDSGLWTTTEFVEYARKMVAAVDIPVFTDTDVCGGNPINVYRTVTDLIHAGVAGMHIEDVQYPKGITESGSKWNPLKGEIHGDEYLVSVEEQVGRLKAGMAARDELDPNFVIIARTQARTARGGSVELAIERGQAYEEAGADMIMFDGMRSWEECKRALASVSIPAFNSGELVQFPRDEQGNPIDMPTVEEKTAGGEKLILWVPLGWQNAVQTAWEELVSVKRDGFGVINEWHHREARRPKSEKAPKYRTEYFQKILDIQQTCLPAPAATSSDESEEHTHATA